MNILSIDWDYFVDASIDERITLFPDGGNENLNAAILSLIWMTRYSDSLIKKESGQSVRSIVDMGVLHSELDALYELLDSKTSQDVSMFMSESHKEIAPIIDEIYRETGEAVNVVNIDFHHDSYDHSSAEIDCGNWVRRLKDAGKIHELTWVRREDSEDSEAMPDFRTLYSITELANTGVLDSGIDVIFICRSGAWSPPHLDVDFAEMLQEAQIAADCGYVSMGDLFMRWNDYTKRNIELLSHRTAEFYHRSNDDAGESIVCECPAG